VARFLRLRCFSSLSGLPTSVRVSTIPLFTSYSSPINWIEYQYRPQFILLLSTPFAIVIIRIQFVFLLRGGLWCCRNKHIGFGSSTGTRYHRYSHECPFLLCVELQLIMITILFVSDDMSRVRWSLPAVLRVCNCLLFPPALLIGGPVCSRQFLIRLHIFIDGSQWRYVYIYTTIII